MTCNLRHPMGLRLPVQDCRREQLLQHNCNAILPHCDTYTPWSLCATGAQGSWREQLLQHNCITLLRHTATHTHLDLRVQRVHRTAEENNFCNTTATQYCDTLQHTYAFISVCNGGTGQPRRTTSANARRLQPIERDNPERLFWGRLVRFFASTTG